VAVRSQEYVIGRREVDNGNSGRPVKQLKGFRKIEPKAGETREVAFTLTSDDLKFYDGEMKYTVEPGEFSVFVGGNSRDVLEKRFVLEGQ
jgi:beta-glucosidase